MKTPKKILVSAIALIAMFFLAQDAQAQINVNAAGSVGIGTNASNSYKVYVYNNSTQLYSLNMWNLFNSTGYKYGMRNYVDANGTGGRYGLVNQTFHNSAGTGNTYGLYNYSNNYGTGTAYGIYNFHYAGAAAATGTRYGIYNYLSCGSATGTKYALYSAVSCGGDYAGYFSGNVFISGTLTQSSDAAKKENIQPLDGALAIVDQLDAKTYNYIQDDNLALPTEKQFGFLAQDVEKIMPTLVKEVQNPSAPVNAEKDGEVIDEAGPQEYETVKSVNYIGMIPVLVKAMQEQQELINEQSAMLKKQQEEINNLKSQVSKH